jgi:hypothetical protein
MQKNFLLYLENKNSKYIWEKEVKLGEVSLR